MPIVFLGFFVFFSESSIIMIEEGELRAVRSGTFRRSSQIQRSLLHSFFVSRFSPEACLEVWKTSRTHISGILSVRKTDTSGIYFRRA